MTTTTTSFPCWRGETPPDGGALGRARAPLTRTPRGCRGAQRFPAFAQLPESVSPTSEFALARVIDDQDDRNLVLIAQDGGRMVRPLVPLAARAVARRRGRARLAQVGMLVCTASLDLGVVRKSFDLHAYDNLLPPEVYEAQVELVRNEVLDRKREAAEAERQARIDRRNQERLEENERRRVPGRCGCSCCLAAPPVAVLRLVCKRPERGSPSRDAGVC